MKTIRRTVVRYRCVVCKTDYHKAREARECEAKPCEKKVFGLGDRVSNKNPRTCDFDKEYTFQGRIIEIRGPLPPDEEYEIKWLGGKRLDRHVFAYIVEYRCPICKTIKTAMYYAPELILLSKARKKASRKKAVKRKAKRPARKKTQRSAGRKRGAAKKSVKRPAKRPARTTKMQPRPSWSKKRPKKARVRKRADRRTHCRQEDTCTCGCRGGLSPNCRQEDTCTCGSCR